MTNKIDSTSRPTVALPENPSQSDPTKPWIQHCDGCSGRITDCIQLKVKKAFSEKAKEQPKKELSPEKQKDLALVSQIQYDAPTEEELNMLGEVLYEDPQLQEKMESAKKNGHIVSFHGTKSSALVDTIRENNGPIPSIGKNFYFGNLIDTRGYSNSFLAGNGYTLLFTTPKKSAENEIFGTSCIQGTDKAPWQGTSSTIFSRRKKATKEIAPDKIVDQGLKALKVWRRSHKMCTITKKADALATLVIYGGAVALFAIPALSKWFSSSTKNEDVPPAGSSGHFGLSPRPFENANQTGRIQELQPEEDKPTELAPEDKPTGMIQEPAPEKQYFPLDEVPI